MKAMDIESMGTQGRCTDMGLLDTGHVSKIERNGSLYLGVEDTYSAEGSPVMGVHSVEGWVEMRMGDSQREGKTSEPNEDVLKQQEQLHNRNETGDESMTAKALCSLHSTV